MRYTPFDDFGFDLIGEFRHRNLLANNGQNVEIFKYSLAKSRDMTNRLVSEDQGFSSNLVYLGSDGTLAVSFGCDFLSDKELNSICSFMRELPGTRT